jgi:hemolysin III
MDLDLSPPRGSRMCSLGEEIANGATHGVGVVLSIAGLTLLLVLAAGADAARLASALVFGGALVFLYSASTAYHFVPWPRAKRVLKLIDHAAIYVLIAATYTPFSLITLRGAGGVWLLAAIWSLALLGVAAEASWLHRPAWLSALVYLVMGWLVLIMLRPLGARLPDSGLALLLAGGLSYSVGTVFYMWKRMPYMHAVWHLFVLGGSVCHFLAVAYHVLPAA